MTGCKLRRRGCHLNVAALFCLVFAPAVSGQTPEFRGFWVNAFDRGFKSAAEVDEMISNALTGNYKAILPEVLAFQDNVGSGHGAYWDSAIVPKASDIAPGFNDPLGYLVQQAHANNIEVHCWLVAFRVCSTWPPSGNSVVQPEWIMVPQGSIGGGPAKVGSYYTLDPGSPDVQEYLTSIVRELVTDYEIDGIHWDYIRYTQTDAGYPADSTYTKSSLARFQQIYETGSTPSPSNDDWEDFRRRTITELVRRTMFEIPIITNPRQPLQHTAALITWGDAPSDFTNSNAYGIFQNWREWMELGYLDAGIPMCYYREYNPPHDQWYRNWVDAAIGWRYSRHMYIGPGIYLNSFADSITQMQYARNAGADGLSTYSYPATNNTGDPWDDWYPYVATNIFTSAVSPPTMPWRSEAMSTNGTVYGRVTDGATGDPIDDAELLVNGGSNGIPTDGNGYYILTKKDADPAGTTYSIGARYPGYADVVRPAVLVERAGFTEANLALGAWLPGDYDVDGDVDVEDYVHFAECVTGAEGGPIDAGCDLFDFDTDNDIDLGDFSEFQASAGS